MTRIRRGYIVRRCKAKIHLFASSFRGAHSRLYKYIKIKKEYRRGSYIYI